MVFEANFKGVSMEFQDDFKEVSKCFMKTSTVSEVFQGYFIFLGFLKVVLLKDKACFLQSFIITQR